MGPLILFILILNICLCLLVLSKNTESSLNKSLFFFGLAQIFWVLFLYLADTNSNDSLIYLRLTYLSAMLMAVAGISLSKSFGIRLPRYLEKISLGEQWLAAVACVFAISPLMVTGYEKSLDGVAQPQLSGYYYFYLLVATLSFWIVIANYVYGLRHSEPDQKRQILYVGYAVVLFGSTAIVINIVIPIFYQSWESSKYGQVTTLLFLVFIYYAIVKQKFLDLRVFAFRWLGYLLTLATLGVVSFFVLTNFSNILNDIGVTQSTQNSFFAAATLFMAVAYQPFRRYFNKLTRKVFFRDAYDAESLMNEFNQTLVSTIDLKQLLERASVAIEKYLKPEFCDFVIRDSESDVTRIITEGKPSITKEAFVSIRSFTRNLPEKIVNSDLMDESVGGLKLLLQEAQIGLLIRITGDPKVEGIGYIVMGVKKSGNMYNAQDTVVMEILANGLAIAVQNALQFEEIQKFNVTLQEKVESATRQLQKSNVKLKALDETKDEFIGMASHQLRTPLTSMKGYVSMVLDGDAGKVTAPQKKLLEQAFISSQRMVYLIADLLNVSRLKTGKFIIETNPTDLAKLIGEEIGQLSETAKGRKLTLTYDQPKNFPLLMLDETKTRQVLMNFIDNAIYYTPVGGHIHVHLEEKGETVECRVEDNGLGVPKSEQHLLFTKFFRAGNAKKARPDGTGLGLFMAKKVIAAQGGAIIFSSTEGKGSVFGFSFAKDKLKVPIPK